MRAPRVTAVLLGIPLASCLYFGSATADIDLFAPPGQQIVARPLMDDAQSIYSDQPVQQKKDIPGQIIFADRGQSMYNRNKQSTGQGRSSYSSTPYDYRDRRSSSYYYSPDMDSRSRYYNPDADRRQFDSPDLNNDTQYYRDQNNGTNNYYQPDQVANTQYDEYQQHINFDRGPRAYTQLYQGGRTPYFQSHEYRNVAGTRYSRQIGPIGHGFYRVQ